MDHCPRVREAVVRGAIAARQTADAAGQNWLRIGFNATPTFGPRAAFWRELGVLSGAAFREAVGYVGIGAFPGAFRPTDPDDPHHA